MRLILAGLFLFLGTVAYADPAFVFDPAPGKFIVGLKVVQQYDFGRTYKENYDVVAGTPVAGERARPMQTLVWYPAREVGRAMTYGDYAETAATEENFDTQSHEVAGKLAAIRTDQAGDFGERFKITYAQSMRATRDAPAAPGKFPVVIYAPSLNAPAHENADLCEYLASHGYIVIASPDMGARTRSMVRDVEGIETAAADIGFLIGYAHSLPQADNSQIAAMGFSWGGLANIIAASRDSRIKAIVSLDGSVRYKAELIRSLTYLKPEKISIPFLLLASKARPIEDLARGKFDLSTNFVNDMVYSDVVTVTMLPMYHLDFSSLSLRESRDKYFSEYTRDEEFQAYGWVARYALNFLDANLKQDASAQQFLRNRPQQNGAPPHLASVTFQAAKAPAPTMTNVLAELDKRGLQQADSIIEKFHLSDPKNKPDQFALSDAAQDQLQANWPDRAIATFKFALLLYPDSTWLNLDIGQAYEAIGNKPLAIASYRRSLALDPGNEDAAERLKALE